MLTLYAFYIILLLLKSRKIIKNFLNLEKKGVDSMKIEKISDTQIRCILNRQDLAERELKITELAYGSEKAQSLFRDMILQASFECGFEADDIPLMIEAIPLSPDNLVLIITKVEDPDELDTRFSSFSPADDNSAPSYEDLAASFADEILDTLNSIHEQHMAEKDTDAYETSEQDSKRSSRKNHISKAFSFDSLDSVSNLAKVIAPHYHGSNVLYKSKNGRYVLVLNMSGSTPEQFTKICNTASEYGVAERTTYASFSYYKEHCNTIIKKDALGVLAEI